MFSQGRFILPRKFIRLSRAGYYQINQASYFEVVLSASNREEIKNAAEHPSSFLSQPLKVKACGTAIWARILLYIIRESDLIPKNNPPRLVGRSGLNNFIVVYWVSNRLIVEYERSSITSSLNMSLLGLGNHPICQGACQKITIVYKFSQFIICKEIFLTFNSLANFMHLEQVQSITSLNGVTTNISCRLKSLGN